MAVRRLSLSSLSNKDKNKFDNEAPKTAGGTMRSRTPSVASTTPRPDTSSTLPSESEINEQFEKLIVRLP
jgi:hypothetical protein